MHQIIFEALEKGGEATNYIDEKRVDLPKCQKFGASALSFVHGAILPTFSHFRYWIAIHMASFHD